MKSVVPDLAPLVRNAVQHFWTVRLSQKQKQSDQRDADRDRGERSAVTGGKHMDGFIRMVRSLLLEAGLTGAHVFCKPRHETTSTADGREQEKEFGVKPTRTVLPGWFRAEKDWDFVVVVNGHLVASLEFKSHVGSFGNNCNNRAEEALGNATDLLAAYREGAFEPSLRPWLGYLMLLEDDPKSTRPVRVVEPHFKVFKEFRGASYAARYSILLTKLLRDRLYDGACLLMSKRDVGLATGQYSEPKPELSFKNFITSLLGHAIAVAALKPSVPTRGPARKRSRRR